MTESEWRRLKLGDIIRYTTIGREYTNTLCEVINPYPVITLKIIKPGNNNYNVWRNKLSIASGWIISDAEKFKIESVVSLPLEIKISNKIKTLDAKWAQTQAKKGNKYAMLCL